MGPRPNLFFPSPPGVGETLGLTARPGASLGGRLVRPVVSGGSSRAAYRIHVGNNETIYELSYASAVSPRIALDHAIPAGRDFALYSGLPEVSIPMGASGAIFAGVALSFYDAEDTSVQVADPSGALYSSWRVAQIAQDGLLVGGRITAQTPCYFVLGASGVLRAPNAVAAVRATLSGTNWNNAQARIPHLWFLSWPSPTLPA